MCIPCPHCHSDQVAARAVGKKTGGFLGLVGGAASGATSALRGAAAGSTVGAAFAGPPGMLLGSLAGATLGALVGGITGIKLGTVVDDKLLDNYRCIACGLTFCHRHD